MLRDLLPRYRGILGLSGSVCSGKSRCRKWLSSRGVVCVDADLLGHAAYEPGGPAYAAVCALFPSALQASSGLIDRRILGDIIFKDNSARAALNAAVWPAVKSLVVEELRRLGEDRVTGASSLIGAVEAALLLEAGWGSAMDGVWLMDVEKEEALRRLQDRGLSRSAAEARVRAQPTAKERQAGEFGGFVTALIDTNEAEEETDKKLDVAWTSFLTSLPGPEDLTK